MHKHCCVNSKECDRVQKFWSDLCATDVRTPQFWTCQCSFISTSWLRHFSVSSINPDSSSGFWVMLRKLLSTSRPKPLLKKRRKEEWRNPSRKSCWHLTWLIDCCTTTTLPTMHEGARSPTALLYRQSEEAEAKGEEAKGTTWNKQQQNVVLMSSNVC